MKKDKKIFLMLSGVLLMSLTACGIQAKTENPTEQKTAFTTVNLATDISPENTVKSTLDALVSLDTKQFNRYVNYNYADTTNGILFKDNILFGDTIDEEDKDLIKGVVSSLSYKVISSKENGDSATVDVQIKNRDLSDLWKRLISETIAEDSEKDKVDLLVGLVNGTDKTAIFNVSLSLEKSHTGWKINMNKKFANAICGGMF